MNLVSKVGVPEPASGFPVGRCHRVAVAGGMLTAGWKELPC